MEIIHLDLEQVTEEELTLAISQNNRTLNELNAEIKKISLASTKQLEEENNFILSKIVLMNIMFLKPIKKMIVYMIP